MGVAAGSWLAVATLPAPPTPTHAAAAYVEARFARDWPTAWRLMCRSMRADMTYRTFVRRVEYVAEYTAQPSDVDVKTGDMDLVRVGSRSYFTVPLRATSDARNQEDWSFTGELPLIQEDGEFRVCLPEEGAWEQ